jgi:hypothetical protein
MEPLPFRIPEPRTVRGSVACADCTWGAVHIGQNAMEVSAFLRELLRRHLAERHPELTLEEGLPS